MRSGGGPRRSSVRWALEWCSGRRDPTARLRVSLRKRCRGSGRTEAHRRRGIEVAEVFTGGGPPGGNPALRERKSGRLGLGDSSAALPIFCATRGELWCSGGVRARRSRAGRRARVGAAAAGRGDGVRGRPGPTYRAAANLGVRARVWKAGVDSTGDRGRAVARRRRSCQVGHASQWRRRGRG